MIFVEEMKSINAFKIFIVSFFSKLRKQKYF